MAHTHYNIEIEHWLLKLLEESNSDIQAILQHYQLQPAVLTQDLLNSLKQLKTGNSRPPALAQNTIDWCREAWLLASLEYGVNQVRSGYLLTALLQDPSLARLAYSLSKQ